MMLKGRCLVRGDEPVTVAFFISSYQFVLLAMILEHVCMWLEARCDDVYHLCCVLRNVMND